MAGRSDGIGVPGCFAGDQSLGAHGHGEESHCGLHLDLWVGVLVWMGKVLSLHDDQHMNLSDGDSEGEDSERAVREVLTLLL